MDGIRHSGEAASVATIRRRRRAVTDADALAIRDLKMLELHVADDLSTRAIAAVFGLKVHSVRDGIRRAKEEIRRRGGAGRLSGDRAAEA